MFAFWIAAAALSAAVAWLMLRGARAAERRVGEGDPAVAVHRRQLAEIDDLAARGLLPETEVRAARAEAGRRLLAAADAAAPATGLGGRRLALAATIAAPLLAVGTYVAVGSPGTPDQPFARRLAEWRAGDPGKLDAPQIAAVLRAVTAERPNDAEAFRNLALAEMASGDVRAATTALRRAVAVAPDRADLWAALGEAFVAEGEGQVGEDARTAFREAVKRDPKSLSARYFLARGEIAEGRAAEGLAAWRALAADLPVGDPNRTALIAEIAQVEKTGGLAEQGREQGPDAAAAQAQAQARAQGGEGLPDADAIRGMVEGLAARLEAEPNDPQGWVRLVRAWSVLGETGKRDAARARAKTLFNDDPDVLRALDQAAEAPR
ncbi:c-type cytochrome biogenesis protein CcmI [Caulobacter mirabilis]|uniref:C-type cytochrome biogenesis protein CcmI n=1 Tax=Caulobacter mirabilis TaxID=69666 RepID=A0A2D2AVV8_9CAUL|nr:c-type cytochrome biogenesis protein CcmI [Caulobacter mirabilis]ATQ42149.1 c-type cytochrome biogenesis protein CcmI [Caulobacter mirabilis]